MAWHWTPPAAETSRPPLSSIVTLSALEIGIAALYAVVQSLLNLGSSGLAGAAAMVAAMTYATWAEQRVPGSMARGALLRWLAFGSTVVQGLVAIPILTAYGIAPEAGDPPIDFMLTVGVPIGLTLGFLITWAGLAIGRRNAIKQRERLAKKISETKTP